MTQDPVPGSGLTLYTSASGIQCHRIRMMLAAKGLGYQREVVDAAEPPDDLQDLNPYADVPTLAGHEMALYDPAVITEYLDERYPHPPLLPIDPLARAALRLAVARVERDWLPLIGRIHGGGNAATSARKQLAEQFLVSLPLFQQTRYFLGDELSVADCLVAVIVWRLPALGVDLGSTGKPVHDYGERVFRTDGFERSLTAEERALRT